MPPTNFTLISVGGCGKHLLRTICNHEPFMQFYSEPGHYLSCFSIDTAKLEANNDRDWATDMSAKHSSVRFEHFDLPSLAHINSIPALIKENTRDTLQLPNDQCWWLNDDLKGIDYNSLRVYDSRVEKTFDQGVYRLRGVSKAVFVMATTRAHNIMSRLFTRPGGSDVAIVCGLGGGTGSGMYIDLALKIKQYTPNCRVWLFALLPAASEGPDERLNAAIALTELENLELTSSPFDHIILTPLDRTNFRDYKASHDTKPVKDFAKVWPYIFTNAFTNHNDEGIVQHSGGFCCFSQSTGRVIEYPISSLQSLEQKYDEYLSLLEQSVTSRSNLYTEVTNFIDKHETTAAFADTGDFEVSVDSVNDVINENIEHFRAFRREVEHLCSLWTQDIVTKLNLSLPEKISSAAEFYDLEDYRSLKTLSELIMFVHSLHICLESVEKTNLNALDKRLLKILSMYCSCLHILGEYYVKTANLEGDVRDYYMSLLRLNNKDVTAAVRALSSEKAQSLRIVSEISTEMNTLRSEIKELTSEKDSYNHGINSIAGRLEGKIEAIRSFCESQTQYGQMESFIKEYITALKEKWQDFSLKIQAAHEGMKKKKPACPPFISKKHRYVSFPTIEATRYPTLFNSEKEREFVEALQQLDEHISDYFYWKYMHIYADRRKFGDGPKVDSRDVAAALTMASSCITKVCKKLNLMNAGKLSFSYLPASEESAGGIEFADDISIVLDLFNEQRRVSAEDIILPLLNMFNLEDRLPDLLQELLAADATVQGVTSVIRQHILESLDAANGWSDTIYQHTEHIKVLEAQEEMETKRAAYLSNLQKLFEKTTLMLQSASELKTEVTLSSSEVSASEFSGETENRDFLTVIGNLNPGVLSQLPENASLAHLDNSLDGVSELNRFADIVRERPSEILDPSMLGARMHTCTHSKKPARMWSFADAALVINTESPHLREQLQASTNANINFLDEINQTINNQQACHCVVQDGAKPWECGITVIAAGNYLENILGFGPGGSLSTAYQQGCTNILHHTLKLQYGKILVRKMLSADEAITAAFDEKAAGLNNDRHNAVRDKILALYEEVNINDVMRGVYTPSDGKAKKVLVSSC